MKLVDYPSTHQKILILFAHPAMHKSKANRELIQPLQNLKDITFHDLYEAYPDFYIDIEREQTLLRSHDIIVFMHPFFWYSAPAILKEWQDLVLEYGFAYGEMGTRLHGKKMLSVITTDGGESSYQSAGVNRYPIKQLLTPFEQTARLCGMKYLPPVVFYDVLHLSLDKIKSYALDLKNILVSLRDNQLDLEVANFPFLEVPSRSEELVAF